MLKPLLTFVLATVFGASTWAQCSVDIATDTVTVYFGYTPLACMDVEAMAIGSDPMDLAWSNGETTATITVCDEVPAWYFVTVSDGTGCEATDSVFVNVMDVRCGANNNKVAICHIPPGNPANAHTICIGSPAVAAHLAHGCQLGACAEPEEGGGMVQTGELQLLLSPNPMVEGSMATLRSTIAQRISLTAVDAMGRTVQIIYEGELAAGAERTVYIGSDDVPQRSQMVWMRLQGASGTSVQRALVIER